MIRKMEREDKEKVLKLARLFFDERLNSLGMSFSRENAEKEFDAIFDYLIALVYETKDEIVGMIAGVKGNFFFCEGKSCTEVGWFVHPKYRKVGVKLFKEFEKEVKLQGCTELLMFGMSDDPVNRFYIKVGYDHLQSMYMKRMG